MKIILGLVAIFVLAGCHTHRPVYVIPVAPGQKLQPGKTYEVYPYYSRNYYGYSYGTRYFR